MYWIDIRKKLVSDHLWYERTSSEIYFKAKNEENEFEIGTAEIYISSQSPAIAGNDFFLFCRI